MMNEFDFSSPAFELIPSWPIISVRSADKGSASDEALLLTLFEPVKATVNPTLSSGILNEKKPPVVNPPDGFLLT